MVRTVLLRTMRLMVISIICSAPMLLYEKGLTASTVIILVSAFLLFTLIVGFDSYAFSIAYWEKKDFFVGMIIPYIIYLVISIACMFWMPSSIYNCIFLPLRSPELIFRKTLISVAIMHIFMILLIFGIGLPAALKGKRRYEMEMDDYD